MINNYLKTSFPVYDKLEKQFRFKNGAKDYSCIFKLYAGTSFLPSFQIRKPISNNEQIISWSIHNLDGSLAFNLNQNIDIFIKNIDKSFENWIYNGNELSFKFNNGIVGPLEICNGTFYSVIEFQSGQKYYSETFDVDDSIQLSNFIKLEWSSSCNIGGIDYKSNYKNSIYLFGELEKCAPEITEEGEEIEGKFIPTLVRYSNRYRISLITPNWLVESLSMISLHTYVTIYTNDNLYTSNVHNVKVENIEWLKPSCYARLDLTFEQEEGSIYTTCCN